MLTAMNVLGVLALLFVGPPLGGDTLSGRVTDSAGAAVPSATVLISELHRVATSGADGAFRLADVPPGEYTVIVRHVGFAPFAREVQVHGPTTLTVTLRRAPVWLEPVTITATRVPSAALGSPLSAAALSEDGLRRDQSVSLAHSLARLPGVNALTTGAQIGKPVIRGLAGARVLVLANGNRLEDYSWSDEDGPSVDARLAQRVELIRGPASVLYGSDAVGGVVNVIPAELPDANGGPRVTRRGARQHGLRRGERRGRDRSPRRPEQHDPAVHALRRRVQAARGGRAAERRSRGTRAQALGRSGSGHRRLSCRTAPARDQGAMAAPLAHRGLRHRHQPVGHAARRHGIRLTAQHDVARRAGASRRGLGRARHRRRVGVVPVERHARADPARPRRAREVGGRLRVRRSEEHTSELQSH